MMMMMLRVLKYEFDDGTGRGGRTQCTRCVLAQIVLTKRFRISRINFLLFCDEFYSCGPVCSLSMFEHTVLCASSIFFVVMCVMCVVCVISLRCLRQTWCRIKSKFHYKLASRRAKGTIRKACSTHRNPKVETQTAINKLLHILYSSNVHIVGARIAEYVIFALKFAHECT